MSARGFTLIEVVVAAIVLEVGLLGVVGMVVLSERTLARADALERGVAEMEGVFDSLAELTEPGSGTRDLDVGTVSWTVTPHGDALISFEPRLGAPTVSVAGRAFSRDRP